MDYQPRITREHLVEWRRAQRPWWWQFLHPRKVAAADQRPLEELRARMAERAGPAPATRL